MNTADLDAALDTKISEARRKFCKSVTDIPSVSGTEAYRINTAALELEGDLLCAAHEHWRDAIHRILAT